MKSLVDLLKGKSNFDFLANVQKENIVQTAITNRVPEILYHHFKTQDTDPETVPHFYDLEHIAQLQYLNSLQRVNGIKDIANVFREEETPFIFFKGFSVAHQAYSLPYLRHMSDIDVLIQQKDIRLVISLLQKSGFHLNTPRLGFDHPFTLKYEHTYNLHRNGLHLDLHNQLHDTRGIMRLSDQQYCWMIQQTQEMILSPDLTITVLRPEIEYLYVGVHCLLHHLYELTVRNYLDVVFLAETPSFDWAFVFDAAIKLGWEDTLYLTLKYTEKLTGENLQQKIKPPITREIENLSMDQYLSSLHKRYTFWNALKNVEKRDRIRFFLRIYLFPAPQYIQEMYGINTVFDWPIRYLQFMFERIPIFLAMRFGVGNQ